MTLINNNLSPLPFYDSIFDQNHYKDYAFGQTYPLILPKNTLIPFQAVLTDSITPIQVSKVILCSTESKEELDITSDLIEGGLSVNECEGFQVLRYFARTFITKIKSEGFYYLRVDFDGHNTIYSEVFNLRNSVDDCLGIFYKNKQNFVLKNGVVDFSNGFEFKCYLDTQIGKPEYLYEEEATTREGYTFIENQISKKVYHFVFIAPEYLCDALRVVRLCDTKIIKSQNKVYDALIFNMEPEWQEQGDLAAVECSFETDNIITHTIGCATVTGTGDFNNDFNNDFS